MRSLRPLAGGPHESIKRMRKDTHAIDEMRLEARPAEHLLGTPHHFLCARRMTNAIRPSLVAQSAQSEFAGSGNKALFSLVRTCWRAAVFASPTCYGGTIGKCFSES